MPNTLDICPLSTSSKADPTQLTTKQLLREVSLLEDKILAQLQSTEKSIDKIHDQYDKVPDIIDRSIQQLNLVHTEKFSSIQTQFKERDTRAEQTSKDSKTAVDAALQAAKEAVGEQNKSSALAISKSEVAVTKQVDQFYALITATNKAVDEKITDVKSRLDLNVGQETGSKGAKEDGKSWIAIGISLVGLLIMVVVEVATKIPR